MANIKYNTYHDKQNAIPILGFFINAGFCFLNIIKISKIVIIENIINTASNAIKK